MENIKSLIKKLCIDDKLIKFCKVHLLDSSVIARLQKDDDPLLELKINVEFDLAHDNLYLGPWNEVPEEFRVMFLILSFLKAFCIARKQQNHNLESLLKALKVIDCGIIMGIGLEVSKLLTEFAEMLHDFIGKNNYYVGSQN